MTDNQDARSPLGYSGFSLDDLLHGLLFVDVVKPNHDGSDRNPKAPESRSLAIDIHPIQDTVHDVTI